MENKKVIIYGLNAVLEAVKAGGRDQIQKLIIAENRRYDSQVKRLVSLASEHNIPVEKKNAHLLDQLSGTMKNQGVVGVAREKKIVRLEDLVISVLSNLKKYPTLLIIEGVEDPRNLGAIIRSAEVFGVDGVIIPKRRAVGITPIVRKSSAGAVEHIPIVTVTNIVHAVEYVKKKGFWTVAAEPLAQKNCYDVDFLSPIAIVLGSEGKGIRDIVKKRCDFLVSIPQKGVTSSLNVSVAGGIFFYEMTRQRIKKEIIE